MLSEHWRAVKAWLADTPLQMPVYLARLRWQVCRMGRINRIYSQFTGLAASSGLPTKLAYRDKPRRRFVFLLLIPLTCYACTNTTYTDLSRQELHEKIASGEIMHPGDKVSIVTAAGKRHEVLVSAITADNVVARQSTRPEQSSDGFEEDQELISEIINIPIDDIVSVEKLEITHPAGQAVVLAGFSLSVVLLLALPGAVIAAMAL